MGAGAATVRRGRFIVFEGPEGAGKSTQIARVEERLRSLGHQPLFTREPGGTPTGEAIREVLLHRELDIEPLTEYLLYSAARAQHVADVISPALQAGRDVVCDRFTGASVAYQGYGRGLELQLIETLNRRVTGGLTPELTLFLDLDPELGLSRVSIRAGQDRLEAAGAEFHRRVREGYVAQAQAQAGGKWVVLDAAKPPDALAEDVWRVVEPLLVGPPEAREG